MGQDRASAPANRLRDGRSRVGHLGWSHPLARVVADRCRQEHGLVGNGVGGVGCGRCWERAIRDDERVVVRFGLPRELVPDPDYVDRIAVERACAGERVPLTSAERATAVAWLTAEGLTPNAIGVRLHCQAPVSHLPLPVSDVDRAAA